MPAAYIRKAGLSSTCATPTSKTLLNGGSFFKIQPLRGETMFQCNALVKVPPLMLLEESRDRYLLSRASVTFVRRYGAIGDAPKRSWKKRQVA